MRLLQFLLLFVSLNATAQMNGFVYPTISTSGTKVEDFIPANWKISKTVSADFNNDKLSDIALVIQKATTVKFEDEEYFPKMLLIIFQNPDKTYKLSISSFKVFGGAWGYSFVDLRLRNNSIKLSFSTGGSQYVKMHYYFYFNKNEWVLAGYQDEFFQRDNEDYFVRDVNFLNRSMEAYALKNGKKVIDKEQMNINEFLRVHHIKSAHINLSDVDLSDFIDPFEG